MWVSLKMQRDSSTIEMGFIGSVPCGFVERLDIFFWMISCQYVCTSNNKKFTYENALFFKSYVYRIPVRVYHGLCLGRVETYKGFHLAI